MISSLVLVFVLAAGAYGGPGRSPNGHELPAEFSSRYSSNVLEDARLDVPGLLWKYGYPREVHNVMTADGYILEMHRIPYGKYNQQQSGDRPVVLFMHGLFSSSADFVNMGPGNGLGYVLADAGYDVWLGNARGNHYSRNHIRFDPDNGSDFWQFSWHEIGYYDIPAMIDHILATTKATSLHYGGHSQGTTAGFVTLATRPEYNAKIRTFQALAPVAYLANQHSSALDIASSLSPLLERGLSALGRYDLLRNNKWTTNFGTLCQDMFPTVQGFCADLLFTVGGNNPDQMNKTMIPVILGHTPAGASVKQLMHYAQSINKGGFQHYDFGLLENLRRYRSSTPWDYNLGNIKSPVFLHYSSSDHLADVEDVLRLASEVNGSELHLVADPMFSHIDYLWAIDAPKLVYEKVLEFMNRHN